MSSFKMGHNQLFSNNIQILDEFLMMYIYLNIDYTWGIYNIYNRRRNLDNAGHIDSHSDCAYGHTRAHPVAIEKYIHICVIQLIT